MLNTIFTSELCYNSVTYYLLMRLSNPLHDQLTPIRWFKSSRCQQKRSERPKFNNRWNESTRNWWRPLNRYAQAQIPYASPVNGLKIEVILHHDIDSQFSVICVIILRNCASEHTRQEPTRKSRKQRSGGESDLVRTDLISKNET